MNKWLKVMYYFGYLPFHWNKAAADGDAIADSESVDQTKFRISRAKTIIILVFDFLLAFLAPMYFVFWHWINIDDFEFSQMFRASYFVQLNGGTVTTALTQLTAIVITSCMFWIFAAFGKLLFCLFQV